MIDRLELEIAYRREICLMVDEKISDDQDNIKKIIYDMLENFMTFCFIIRSMYIKLYNS